MEDDPKFRVINLADPAAREELRRERHEWWAQSPWEWNGDNLTLTHSGTDYEVDVEKCKTSAGMLDLIMQVAGKAWADDSTIAWLVRELNWRVDPQATLCSGGAERGPINVREVVERIEKRGC